jgi:hypothetical protein
VGVDEKLNYKHIVIINSLIKKKLSSLLRESLKKRGSAPVGVVEKERLLWESLKKRGRS